MMPTPPRHHPEAAKRISFRSTLTSAETGAIYAAFAEARKLRTGLPVGRAVEAYRAYLIEKGYSRHTLRSMGHLLSAFYRASGFSALTPLVAVTREKAEQTIQRLLARVSPVTAWSYSVRLMALFRVFAAGGLLLENPFAMIDPPPRPKLLPGPVLSREEMQLLMAVSRTNTRGGLRNRALLEFMYSTGARLSECANVKLGDVDFAKGVVAIRGGKGGKDRVVPLGTEAANWLQRYLKEVRPRYACKGEEAVWMCQAHRPLSSLWIQKTVHNLGKRAGLRTPVTPHTLRRTCATHLLSGGASAWMVKEILGHSNTQVLGRYLNIAPQELKNVHEQTHPRA